MTKMKTIEIVYKGNLDKCLWLAAIGIKKKLVPDDEVEKIVVIEDKLVNINPRKK